MGTLYDKRNVLIAEGIKEGLDVPGVPTAGMYFDNGKVKFHTPLQPAAEGGADTAALLLGVGNTTTRARTTTADRNFVGLWTENAATSGDNRGIYNRFYLSGAGGGGESLRTYTTVLNVAGGTAHGAHISLDFGTSGSLTGQGIAARCTLHMPSTALPASNVTYAAVQAEIYSDGAASDPSGNLLSAIRIINDGNATGMADVDDDCAAFQFNGWTEATGNMIFGRTIRVRITTTDEYLVLSSSENRLDLSNINVSAGNTDGGVIKIGTAASPVTEDTADMKFLSFYFDNGATSGDNRGIYNRLYLTGAGGGGESLRSYTDVSVAAGTAHGAHISLGFGESTTVGSITGLGAAVRATLGFPNGASPAGGTYCAVMAELYSFGANADAGAVTSLSVFRVVNDGNATGMADMDDDCNLFDFAGWVVGDANMIATDGSPTTMPNATHSIRVRLPSGALAYMYLGATPVTA